MAAPTVVYLKTTPTKGSFTNKTDPPNSGTQEPESEEAPKLASSEPGPYLCCVLLQSAGSSEKVMITPLAEETSSKPAEKYTQDICFESFATEKFQCHCCPALFEEADSLAQHLQLHAESETLKCEVCSKRFMYHEDLRLHLEVHAGLRRLETITFACTMCPKVLRGTSALSAHVNMHEDDSTYKCIFCRMPFRAKQSHERHMLRHVLRRSAGTPIDTGLPLDNAPPPKSPEPEAEQEVEPEEEAEPEQEAEPNPRETFPCELCPKVLKNNSAFSAHMRMHVEEGTHKCPVCSVPFLSKNRLDRHIRKHARKRTKRSGPSQESPLEPVQNKHTSEPQPESCTTSLPHDSTKLQEELILGIKQEPCNDGTQFPSHSSMDSQEELILAVKQEPCNDSIECLSHASTDSLGQVILAPEREFCRDAVESQDEHKRSPVSHPDSSTAAEAAAAPAFTCSTCSGTFPTRHILELHEIAHGGQQCARPTAKRDSSSTTKLGKLNGPSCKVCKEVFNYKSAYRKHVRKVHPYARGYSCSICSVSFHVKDYLKKHMISHGERPYKCDWCGLAFKRKDTLNTHENIHTGRRPYKCKVCGDDFGQRVRLWYHMKLHKALNVS